MLSANYLQYFKIFNRKTSLCPFAVNTSYRISDIMAQCQTLNEVFKTDLLKQLPTFQKFERKLLNEKLPSNITHGKVLKSNINGGRITVFSMIHHIFHKKNIFGSFKMKNCY